MQHSYSTAPRAAQELLSSNLGGLGELTAFCCCLFCLVFLGWGPGLFTGDRKSRVPVAGCVNTARLPVSAATGALPGLGKCGLLV